jgi:hypothetical protein
VVIAGGPDVSGLRAPDQGASVVGQPVGDLEPDRPVGVDVDLGGAVEGDLVGVDGVQDRGDVEVVQERALASPDGRERVAVLEQVNPQG